MRRRPSSATQGFSLVEVMVALAILGVALVLLVGITTQNVRSTFHAKMLTAATFLARAKMADLEDAVQYEGFVDLDETEEGDFSAAGRADFTWKTVIEKVQLPADMAQKTQDANQQNMQEHSTNPMAAMAGLMGGFMTTLIEPIRVGLEESVRRVSVQVFWHEAGRPDQNFEVVTFMTDPAKLDAAVAAIGQPAGSTDTSGNAGASGTSGTNTGAAGATGGNRPPAAPSLQSPSSSGRSGL